MGKLIERELNLAILNILSNKSLKIAEILFADKEIKALQEYANHVSIRRLNFNDHGPVHMRKVVLNSLVILDILHQGGILLNLEEEGLGDYEETQIVLLLAGFLHDLGMSVGRDYHDVVSVMTAKPYINRILETLYSNDFKKKSIISSFVMECILGHMGHYRIHTREAGVILVADGCDMEMGRARIPTLLDEQANVGDIHQFSSSAIESVEILPGNNRPLLIRVNMLQTVGFFQVEEVLMKKINSSTIKPHMELLAGVKNKDYRQYL